MCLRKAPFHQLGAPSRLCRPLSVFPSGTGPEEGGAGLRQAVQSGSGLHGGSLWVSRHVRGETGSARCWPADSPAASRARLPFSVCSMIWRIAFFRLLALSMSCSRGRNICGRAGQADPTARSPVEPEPQLLPAPSPSSTSSAMVGGGVGREDEAWDSSSRVLRRESSFSFRTEHWAGNRGGSGGAAAPPRHPPQAPRTHLLGHDLRLLRALGGLLVGLPHPSHEVLHGLAEHSVGGTWEEASRETVLAGTLAPPRPPGTHLADEITTECWSEVRILERWAATESS